MKKIFIGIGIVLLLLLGALFALPYFFKDEIILEVKKAANENLTAVLDFKDVDISVFRHFPKLSVGLDSLDITGTGVFDGTKLVQCERLDVGINLWKAIVGDVIIEGLYFKKPNIHVYVLSDGTANYDITKPEPEGAKKTETAESSPIRMEHYAIEDGNILYDDRSLDMRAEIVGLNHEGSGEFTSDIYDLAMKTGIERLSVNYGGMQYLRNARTDWTTTLNADMKKMRFTLKENNLKVNDLALDLNGWVEMPDGSEDILMDLTFGTPANTFKSLLSIIPGAYTKDFAEVQANGSVQFDGFARGKYNETTYPAFKLNFKVGNADFKYPSLPLGVSNINVDATINSPSQSLNAMTVNIPSFSLKIGSNPLEGYFNLKTPESDPTVDTKIKGTLNLGELSKAFPMEGVQELAGIIRADMTAKAAMSQIDQQRYDEVQMNGTFGMQGLSYRSADMPAVKINNLATTLSPQRLDIQTFDAKLGASDLRASGSIDNVLAYFSTNKTMTGNLSMSSNYFDANEWMGEETAATTGGVPPQAGKTPSDTPAAVAEETFDRWDFTVDGKVGRLKYEDYNLTDVALAGHFKPNAMDISNFGLKINGSDLSGNGKIINAWNYLFDDQTLSGVVNLNSNYFDLNQFMTEEPAAAAKTAKPAAPPPPADVIPVPENMDMTLIANFKQVKYTNLTLNNLDGKVLVKNSSAKLQDCTAGVLGGLVALTGEYNTQAPSKPLFNMDLALQNMSFKDAFQNFVTVKTLAPVAQLIDGKFNTTLSIAGILGKDMTPDFNTLTAAGFIETLSAVFNNFKPINEIASKLNVSALQRFELKNTKNWFEVKDGQVIVKPFNTNVGDVALQIGGSHGLSNEMNYQFLTKTPRSALQKSAAGAAVNSGLNFLSKEASKYGVNIAQGEFINVRFDVTGTLFSPKVSMKVLGSDGQSTLKEEAGATLQATVDKARDSLKTLANQQVDKAKDKAQAAADSLKRVAEQKAQEAKDKAVEQAKKEAEKALGQEAGKKVEDALGKDGQKKVDEVKGKLDKWDPFKKKKN